MSDLRDVLGGIYDTAADLLSLDVATFSGNVSMDGAISGESIDLSKIFDSIKQAAGDAELRLVAHTHIDFDKDSVNFVAADLTPGDAALVTAHKEMVTASVEGRLAMLTALRELINL